MVDLSYYTNLLSNTNMQAFLKVIRKGEGTISSSGYSTTFGGGTLPTLSILPTIDTFYTNSSGIRGSVVGAYQFGNSSSNPVLPNLANMFQWDSFVPTNQDIGAIQLIKEKSAVNNIINGDITTAISKLNNPLWPSLPGGSQQQQNLNSALSFYTSNGGTLNAADTATLNSGASLGTATNTLPNDNATALQQQFKTNLQAIENNVSVQEADNSLFSWGARQNDKENSDWIGLRQFLMYLSMTYEPQSIIPFVELIPKFFMDESQNYSQQQDKGDNATNQQYQISTVQQNKFTKTKNVFNNLNNIQKGGIDLLTIDPFQDISAFNQTNTTQNAVNTTTTNSPNIRNFGYRIFGTVVLNPGIQGDETSKAGPIGFKSLDISSGANFLQGLTLVTIKLLDVQGNKFLDITSPWSFLLNASQINGDFYFRYGWQIKVPKFDEKNIDKNSTSYKFWNHPGWTVFGSRDSNSKGSADTITKLKKDIYSMSQKGGTGVLNLTQSPNIKSIENPGYEESTTNDDGSISTGLFSINRKLSIDDYMIISMINPELNINSEDGSVTAVIQFRMNTAMANCMCYLADCQQIHTLIHDSTNNTITLENLMRAFVTDNKNYIANNEKLKKYKNDVIDTTQPTDSWVWVTNLNNKKIDAKDIKITISQSRINEITSAFNSKSSQTNNITGRAWITEVCSENGLTLTSSGDPGVPSAGNSSAFRFIYDDKDYNNNTSNASSADNDAGTGFLGNGDVSRIVLQDDVFSFRFRGSLVESIGIENNENPTAQNNENINVLANSDAGKNTVTSKGTENNDPSKPSPPDPTNSVTIDDKNRYMQYLLSKMSSANIKCICHPWLRICMTIYIKGTGYFDGKYIISKLKHSLDSSNKFITEIVAVRVLNDTDYADNQQKINDDRMFAYSNPDARVAQNVSRQPVPTNDKTYVANNNNIIIQKQKVTSGIGQ